MPLGKQIYNPLSLSPKSAFLTLFEFTGTLNSNNWLTVPAALAFRRDVCGGEDAIMTYSIDLARRGGDRAAEILGTDVLDNEEGTLRDCAFANVRVPLNLSRAKNAPPLGALAQRFIARSAERGTLLAVGPYNGVLYWRLSGQAYLDMTDVEKGAHVLKDLCAEIQGNVSKERARL